MALNFTLSEKQSCLRDTARAAFHSVSENVATSQPCQKQLAAFDLVWSALTNCGFFGTMIPLQYGGNECGLVSASLMMEELAICGLHNFMPILNTIDTICIARFGSETIKQELLPKIARGELKLALAVTEKKAGFNIFQIETFAEKRGDQYLINGDKIYISGVDVADLIMLVVRTISFAEAKRRKLSKTAGISLMLVAPDTKGLKFREVPSRGEGVLKQFALEFNNVEIPAMNLIGEEHGGAEVMFHSFNPERILVSAMALGVSQYCLNLACEHARNRTVFKDTPIGTYQSVQHPLAEVAIRQKALRWMIYHTAWLFDQNAPTTKVAESAIAAKFLASELVLKAVDAAIDTFGGKGFDEDYGVVHFWELARFLKTSPISNALVLNQIAEHDLNLPRSY